MITIHGGTTTVTLPWALTWTYANPRQTATKVALAGNEIQQYSAKSTSAGTFSYSALVPAAAADALDALQYTTGEVTASDGKNAWLVTLDAQITPANVGSLRNLTLSMKCIRKVV